MLYKKYINWANQKVFTFIMIYIIQIVIPIVMRIVIFVFREGQNVANRACHPGSHYWWFATRISQRRILTYQDRYIVHFFMIYTMYTYPAVMFIWMLTQIYILYVFENVKKRECHKSQIHVTYCQKGKLTNCCVIKRNGTCYLVWKLI